MLYGSIDSNCDDGGGMEIQMAGRAGEKSSLSGISIVSSHNLATWQRLSYTSRPPLSF